MPKVAILRNREYDFGDEGSIKIAESISDWTEVTDEELRLLRLGQGYPYSKIGQYSIIVREENERQFVEQTVKQVLEEIKKEKEQYEKKQERYKKGREEAKKKRELRALEKLKAKYEK